MSNLDNLVKKIVDDARIKADEIVKEATDRKETVIKSKIDEANREKEKTIDKAHNEAQLLKQRIVSNAELKVRDQSLRVKRSIIDMVIEESKNKLRNIEEKDYIEFVDNNLKNITLKGDEILVVQKGMEKKLKPSKNYPKISKEENVESGFMLKNEGSTMNYTFDALVEYMREELESEIASILFKE